MNTDVKQSDLSPSASDADLWELYRKMLWSRLFEEAVQQLWEQGKISGEMHLGMGEEAIAAGPAAVGFALAAQYLRPGALAVAFFGEGAVNQGMMARGFGMPTAEVNGSDAEEMWGAAQYDPVLKTRKKLRAEAERLRALEAKVIREVEDVVSNV